MHLSKAKNGQVNLSLSAGMSRELLLLSEETSKVGHWIVDISADLIYWSDEVYRIHGVLKEEFTPNLANSLDFYHPDDRLYVEQCVEKAIAEGIPFNFDARLKLTDHDIRHVTARCRCVIENGTTTKIFGTFTDITDRYEERLRTEMLSEQLKRFIESSYDGFWNRHFQNDYEYISPRFWNILGYDSEDSSTLPKDWRTLVFPEDLIIIDNNFSKHIKTRGAHPFHQEIRCYHKNGSVLHIIYKGKVVAWGEHHQPLRMVGSHTDITAQRHAQKAAEEYAERFNVCVTGSNAGMWDWNIRTNELFWSERFKEIIGITKDNFVPHFTTFSERLHPQDKDRVLEALQAHIDSADIPYNLEYRLMHTSGHYIHIHAKGQSVRDNITGEAVRMAGSVDDISDIVVLRDKERAHHQLLSLMLEKSPDAIFVKDSAYRIVQANQAFLRFYPEEERASVIGTTTLEKYAQEERDEFLKHDKSAFENGISETTETIHFPNNTTCTLDTKKVRFEGIGGEPHILCIARDVTEREALITELNRSNDELEDFAYIAAHDLKEPLRGMHNHARFLLDDHKDELSQKAADRAKRITVLATHAEHMISDLLYFSRISRAEEIHVSVNIKQLVSDVADSIIPEQKHAELVMAGDFPVMQCNRPRIAEVFRNLITNGLKYNDTSEKLITVGVLPRDVNKDINVPVFYVKDNGIGINKRHHQEIFRIFKQVHQHKKYEKSSGLGLTIVKKIIQNHQGDIWIESTPGKGTTCFFTIGEIASNP